MSPFAAAHTRTATLREYAQQARHYAGQGRDYARAGRDHVRAHPLQSAFLAFMAGLVYGRLAYGTRVHVVRVPVPVIPPEVGASLQAGAHAAAEMADRQIRRHPLAGAGLALGAGALLVRGLAGGGPDDGTALHNGLAVRRPRAAVEGPFRAQGGLGAHPLAGMALGLLAGALLGMAPRH